MKKDKSFSIESKTHERILGTEFLATLKENLKRLKDKNAIELLEIPDKKLRKVKKP